MTSFEAGGHNHEPLPQFLDFETRAVELGIAGLDEAIRRASYPENQFDISELQSLQMLFAWRYVDILRDQKHDEVTRTVAMNAIIFAVAASSHIVGNRLMPLYPTRFVDPDFDPDTIKQTLIDDKDTYLQARPHLQAWINRYMIRMDQDGTSHDIAEIVATTTLKDIEDRQRQMFIDLEVAFHAEEM